MRLLALPLLFLATYSGAFPRPDVAPGEGRPGFASLRPEPALGFNVQPNSAEALLPRVRAVGVRHVRVSWWAWTTPEDWSWYPAYRRAGIEVLPLVYADPGDPATIGIRIANRYRKLYDAYGPFPYVQLDNEPDGDGAFGIPNGDPYTQGRRWGEQMKEAARRIRRFDPEVKIVTSGVAWSREGVRDWVRGVVDVGGFDVLAIHPYGIGSAGEPLSRYRAVREAGWRGPVWASELGTNDIQAAYIKRDADAFQVDQMREILTRDPSRFGYERLYWFQLTADPEGYGIIRLDGTPRPAYNWLRSRRR